MIDSKFPSKAELMKMTPFEMKGLRILYQEEEQLVQNTEVRKLRHAFEAWCDQKLRPATAKSIKHFFDLIVMFDGSQKELLEEFAARTGMSVSRAKQILYIELPKCLRQFSSSPEGKGFSLAKRIKTKIDQERVHADRPEPTPAPEAPVATP